MSPFRYDSPVMLALTGIGNLILLNFCYVFMCLPIFTIGAATSALYAVYTSPKDETWCVTKFFRTMRRDLRQGTLYALSGVVAGVILAMSYYCLANYDVFAKSAIYVLLYVITAIFFAMLAYGFALISRYENTVSRVIKNAFLLVIQTMPISLIVGVVTAAPLLLLLLDSEVFLYSILYWLAAGFAVCAKINCAMINRIFKKVEQQSMTADSL